MQLLLASLGDEDILVRTFYEIELKSLWEAII